MVLEEIRLRGLHTFLEEPVDHPARLPREVLVSGQVRHKHVEERARPLDSHADRLVARAIEIHEARLDEVAQPNAQ